MTTPSYYPVGWDADRWQTAAIEEFATLTKEDFERFHTGMRTHLGADGAESFFEERRRRRAEIKAAEPSSPPPESDQPPNFILSLNHLRDEDGGFEEWGFVVFRTAGYGSDDVVRDVKENIEAYLDRQFIPKSVSLTPNRLSEVQRPKEKFRLMWIESADLDGATPEEVAERYRELNVPFGLAHCLFLCVDESSIKSIQQEHGLAHILAVSVGCGEEPTGDEVDDEEWTGSFKVAVRSLITELFSLIGDSDLVPYEIGCNITPDLVWTGSSRFGGRGLACSDGYLDRCGKPTRISTQEQVTLALLERRLFNREKD